MGTAKKSSKAARHGRSDARVWLSETRREDWVNVLRSGREDADSGLINAIGTEETAKLFGVRAYWRGNTTRAFDRACAEYSRAWNATVRGAL